ncbi:class I SAM-dependent methyltransferase [soil metagenome]
MNQSSKIRSLFSAAPIAIVVSALLLQLGGCASSNQTAPASAAPTMKESEIASGPSSASPTRDELLAIIASPDRRAADRTNDIRRKPVEMLYFIGVNRGMNVLDLSAGGGYTSELLARTVGPKGRVIAQVAPRPEGPPPSFASLTERANSLTAGKIVPVLQKFETPVPADMASNNFELATMMFNYHDLGHLGVDRAQMNKAVFAALKPGSMYIIADHSGRPGTGISESSTLHRVEEGFVRKEVEAAGFKFIESAEFLRNPADPRDKNVPDNGQPKDEFVLKFVKP